MKSRAAWKTESLKINKNEKGTIFPFGQQKLKNYYEDLLIENRKEFKNVTYKRQLTMIHLQRKKLKNFMRNEKQQIIWARGIPVEYLHCSPDVVLENLNVIFNKCLNVEVTPSKILKNNMKYKYPGVTVTKDGNNEIDILQ